MAASFSVHNPDFIDIRNFAIQHKIISVRIILHSRWIRF